MSASPNDKIKGRIRDTCSAGTLTCPTWRVRPPPDISGKSITQEISGNTEKTFDWAFAGVLEVHNLNQCSDLPPNGQLTFSDVALYGYNFDQISDPNWSTYIYPGLTPPCGYGIQINPNKSKQSDHSSSTSVTLDYATFVTLHSFNGADGANPDAGSSRPPMATFTGPRMRAATRRRWYHLQDRPQRLAGHPTQVLLQKGAGTAYSRTRDLFRAAAAIFTGQRILAGAAGGRCIEITPAGALTRYTSSAACEPALHGRLRAEAGLARPARQSVRDNLCGGGDGSGTGTVFRITPSGALTTLYSLASPNHLGPDALVQAGDAISMGPQLRAGRATAGPFSESRKPAR